MPSKTDYSRKTKWKTGPYRGERSIGGNFVYSGENLLDKHLFVHRVAPGGFDWGCDASDEKAGQLAIALLAPFKSVDYAVKNYHLFAENFVRRELTEDSWELKRSDFRNPDYLRAIDGRDYPENTAPGPEDVPDLEDVDFDTITYAEEIALAEKYDDLLWHHGNRRDNLRRLLDIWNGDEDPSSDSVSSSRLYRLSGLSIPSNARSTLVHEFDTMGDLAGWVCFGRHHHRLNGISEATAKKLRAARPGFIQYFGGEEYIPVHEGREMTLSEATGGESAQQTFRSALADGSSEDA
ncbi:DUF6166 domain-containing protein [Haloplanus halophilus]|uniref:DUF6166 domain-containing protein n=1 Tax=Haloplanus halophilus TaxID=2949993 RepID=UPI00203FF47D|nr:DUF6166 domain-containing protein [Haloplanus sp. GDY1]